ncbi:uncharacterized protein BDZ99DRAFT_536533 [Mytilinidion resinicola]|uniref:BTB domain-containing protein n=1 Tax=Mytilinidion resinicola TaxID=574789 RepID=A0A6A6YF43_9PEZI|nr:uncharacterized protein BDZ99DRAFT_536533 [Mytilinidion resinicola]KAF2807229.1 hypothetical protein BDZ99DRAFT_536533 [Mytilinidion resinicola]
MDPAPDVQLVLAYDKVLPLHSSVLARHSKRFASILTHEFAAVLCQRAKQQGVTIRWRIELRGVGVNGNSVGRLELDTMGQLIQNPSYGTMIPLNENGKVPTKYFEYYTGIIGTFYGQELTLNDVGIQSALEDAIGLIEVAEYLGSVAAVSKNIDLALIKQGQVLFRSIANNPLEWVDLAVRITSEIIFKEAVVHLVGRWNEFSSAQKSALGKDVKRVCLKHADHLSRQRRALELQMGVMYPGGITHPPNAAPVKRDTYAADIMMWMAVCLFRQWLMQQIIQDKTFRAKDGGYALYKQLSEAGDKYLSRQTIAPFFRNFPMTKKGQNVFENHLLELKEVVKGSVAKSGLLESESALDTGKFKVPWLTCTVVDKADFPWVKKGPILGQKRVRDETHENDENEIDWDEDLEANADNKRVRE